MTPDRTNPREIGPIPPVADPARRTEAQASFRFFLECYFSSLFFLTWSARQRACIDQAQQVVAGGGGIAGIEMERGDGKTSLCERAALWAALRGSHPMVDLVAATDRLADAMRRSILFELERNDVLAADFPEICVPFRRLEGILHRILVCDGQPVALTINRSTIVLPGLSPHPAAGSVIRIAGLHGGLQGATFRRPDGRVVRSSLVIIDDPPRSDSFRRDAQTRLRVRLMTNLVTDNGPESFDPLDYHVLLAGR